MDVLVVLSLPKQAFKYATCQSLPFPFMQKECHLFPVKGQEDVCIQATFQTHAQKPNPENLQTHIRDDYWDSNRVGGLYSPIF